MLGIEGWTRLDGTFCFMELNYKHRAKQVDYGLSSPTTKRTLHQLSKKLVSEGFIFVYEELYFVVKSTILEP